MRTTLKIDPLGRTFLSPNFIVFIFSLLSVLFRSLFGLLIPVLPAKSTQHSFLVSSWIFF